MSCLAFDRKTASAFNRCNVPFPRSGSRDPCPVLLLDKCRDARQYEMSNLLCIHHQLPSAAATETAS